MEHLSSNMEQQHEQVQWRRDKVQSFAVKVQPKGDITNIASWTGYGK